jgi:hypothetical protein
MATAAPRTTSLRDAAHRVADAARTSGLLWTAALVLDRV